MVEQFPWHSSYNSGRISSNNYLKIVGHGDFEFGQKSTENTEIVGLGVADGRSELLIDTLFMYLYFNHRESLEQILEKFRNDERTTKLDTEREFSHLYRSTDNFSEQRSVAFRANPFSNYSAKVNSFGELEIYQKRQDEAEFDSRVWSLINPDDVEHIFFGCLDMEPTRPFKEYENVARCYQTILNDPLRFENFYKRFI